MPDDAVRPAHSMPVTAHINAIGTATPDHDIHGDFIAWARAQLGDRRERMLFGKMVERSGIEHRWSVLPPAPGGGSLLEPGGFYADDMPPTSARMAAYAAKAPELALAAIAALDEPPAGITHLVVASCTGFVAPGVDQMLAERLGLGGDVERVLIGFMGCYGAVTALRTARHIVRSEPQARVLVVSVELSTIHLSPAQSLEPLLAMLLFGDGAAAAIVSAEPTGLAIDRPFAATLAESAPLIGWRIGDRGFEMHLSGEVPTRIGAALADPALQERICGDRAPDSIDAWAVHAGGRSILGAVEKGLGLASPALATSRAVLRDQGNMSSATLMFALARLLERGGEGSGVAIAFGPGLAAEGFGMRLR